MSDVYYYAIEQQLEDGTWTRDGVYGTCARKFADGLVWRGEELIRQMRASAGVELDKTSLRCHNNMLHPEMAVADMDAGAAEVSSALGRPTRIVEIVELITDKDRKVKEPDPFWQNAKAQVLEALAAEAMVSAMTGQPMKPVAHDITGVHALDASASFEDQALREKAREDLKGVELPKTDARRFETFIIRDNEETGCADEIIVSRQEADVILAWAATVPGWDALDPQIRTREQS